ncbi:MAG TPA: hypothetical protein PK668_01735 [Myxococcota bacterium]|nr:hypothetical protein [Myxococcota bacterium]HRY94711.1 hypothetical protein [Myxococcota bacterium]HSA21299.1 hypothetical protein [Myxococcota bacterium]
MAPLASLCLCSWLLLAPASGAPAEQGGLELWVLGATELAPGAEAALRVVVRRAEAPVADVEVELWLASGGPERRRLAAGRTDSQGGLELRFMPPAPPLPDASELIVQLPGLDDGVSARRALRLRDAARLALQLERRALGPGEPLRARLVLLESPGRRPLPDRPARLRLLAPDGRQLAEQALTTGPGGVAAARLPLPAAQGWLRVRAEAASAAPAERWVWIAPGSDAAPRAPAAGPLQGPVGLELPGDARVFSPGQSLRLRLRAPEALRTAYLDVRQDGRCLASRAVPLAGGLAEPGLALEAGWEGPLELLAYALGPCGRIWSARRTVRVEVARRLEVTVVRWHPRELAGGQARVRLEVRDAAGQPRAAWLGVVAVAADGEAALGEAGWEGEEVLPIQEVPAPWETDAAAPGGAGCALEALALRWPALQAELHAPRLARIGAALERYGQENLAWWRVSAWDEVRAAWAPPGDVLGRLVVRGLLPAAEARDAWGQPLALAQSAAPRGGGPLRYLGLRSPGADGRPGTADDLELPLGAPAAEAVAAPGQPVPPQGRGLLFAPELATDALGQLELDVPLPPGPSPCWLLVSAHSADGGAGLARHRVLLRPR